MKSLKPIYERYKRDFYDAPLNVFEAYKRPSEAKIDAQHYCHKLLRQLNGYNPCVLTHNSQTFTYSFMYSVDNTAYFVYITPTYDRKYDINTGETSLL